MDWRNQDNESKVTDVDRLLDEAKNTFLITGINDFREKLVNKSLDQYFYRYRQRLTSTQAARNLATPEQ